MILSNLLVTFTPRASPLSATTFFFVSRALALSSTTLTFALVAIWDKSQEILSPHIKLRRFWISCLTVRTTGSAYRSMGFTEGRAELSRLDQVGVCVGDVVVLD
jgi:hypothetical protein